MTVSFFVLTSLFKFCSSFRSFRLCESRVFVGRWYNCLWVIWHSGFPDWHRHSTQLCTSTVRGPPWYTAVLNGNSVYVRKKKPSTVWRCSIIFLSLVLPGCLLTSFPRFSLFSFIKRLPVCPRFCWTDSEAWGKVDFGVLVEDGLVVFTDWPWNLSVWIKMSFES